MFFLTAVVEQAQENCRKAKAILDLYERMKIALPQIAPSQFTIQTLDAFFDRPVFKTIDFVASTGMARRSATRILTALCDNGVLKLVREVSGRKPAVLAFAELIAITEGRIEV